MLRTSTWSLLALQALALSACAIKRPINPLMIDPNVKFAVPADLGLNDTTKPNVDPVCCGYYRPDAAQYQGVRAEHSIYFDYDALTIKDEYRDLLLAHGQYLAKNKDRAALIEGHTDERGGREYNLALGQMRAEAVGKALLLLGASEQQIEPVSYGMEKPLHQGSDEASWAKNRRVDIVYRAVGRAQQ